MRLLSDWYRRDCFGTAFCENVFSQCNHYHMKVDQRLNIRAEFFKETIRPDFFLRSTSIWWNLQWTSQCFSRWHQLYAHNCALYEPFFTLIQSCAYLGNFNIMSLNTVVFIISRSFRDMKFNRWQKFSFYFFSPIELFVFDWSFSLQFNNLLRIDFHMVFLSLKKRGFVSFTISISKWQSIPNEKFSLTFLSSIEIFVSYWIICFRVTSML